MIKWLDIASGKFKFIHAGFCVRFNYELLYGFIAVVYMPLFVVLHGGCSKLSGNFENFKFHAQTFFVAMSSKYSYPYDV